MPIFEYSGADRCGKTTLAVGDYFRLLEMGCYLPEESCGNQAIFIKGYRHLSNEKLMNELERCLIEHWMHKIFFIDDASGFLPARGYGDKRQTNVIKHIWQIQKQFCYIFYTDHVGKSVDLILDEATHYTILPHYVEKEDRIYYTVIYRRDFWYETGIVNKVSNIQKRFNSWLPSGINIENS